LFSWATQLPLLFRPMITRFDVHDGGSSMVSTTRSCWLPRCAGSDRVRSCDEKY
jgi:hypothetical protein